MPPETGALLIAAAVVLPLAGALIGFAAPTRARATGAITSVALAAVAAALSGTIAAHGERRVPVGGWGAPLGIELRADGLSAFMLLTTAAVGVAALLYGDRYFRETPESGRGFVPLSLLSLAGLNALFVSGDIFNLYVTLELVGLSAAALVATSGGAAALTAAMRYLLVTFLASSTYLLGVALIYHLTGTLDLRTLGTELEAGAAAWTALCLMTGAMLMKSALFPLHFWLPPAYSSASAPVSALIAALVTKSSFYLLLRLWLELMPEGRAPIGAVLGSFGAAAIVWGAIQALRQDKLKRLVAYSTVGQLGYLFVPFAIQSAEAAAIAWRGAIYLVLSHALAKSAMFLSVGNIQLAGGDRLRELDQVVRRLPLTTAAFAVAGVTIAGLPPSGGFIGKWLLLEALVLEQRWFLAGVVLLGGVLSAIYVFKVVGPTFTGGALARTPHRVPASMEWLAFTLAAATIVLGFTAPPLLSLLGLLGAGPSIAGAGEALP